MVAGAGSGIGQAACKVLASQGATVVGADVDLQAVQNTISRLLSGQSCSLLLIHSMLSNELFNFFSRFLLHLCSEIDCSLDVIVDLVF